MKYRQKEESMQEAVFKLKSSYKPTGDQPEAIKALSDGVLNGDKEQVLMGVTGSGKTFTMANIIANVNRPTLVLAHNNSRRATLLRIPRVFPRKRGRILCFLL